MRINWNYFDNTEEDDDITYAEKAFRDVDDWNKNKKYLDNFSYARICDSFGDMKEDYEDEEDPDMVEYLFQHLEDGDYVEVGWEFEEA